MNRGLLGRRMDRSFLAAAATVLWMAMELTTFSAAGARVDISRDQVDSGHLRGLLQGFGEQRISGGKAAPKGRFPYLFSLRSSMGIHKCGAVLVHPRFCLTSAHCVHPKVRGSVKLNALLAIGAYDSTADDRTPGVQMIKVQRTHVHPHFNPAFIYNGSDLALLQLAEASTVTPVPLPDPNYLPAAGDFLLALGWGLGSDSTLQQEVFLQAQGAVECRKHWVKRKVPSVNFGDTFMCAMNSEADTCKGDSGGPLLIPHIRDSNISAGRPDLDTLVAITSFGDPDCTSYEVPGVYTLTAPYVSWIEEVTLKSGGRLEEAPRVERPCAARNYEPKSKLSLSPVKFTFDLLKLRIPATCGDLEFDSFQRCASELGKEEGCCEKECTDFLATVKGRCWQDIETLICAQNSNQTAIMLDLLIRRCDYEKPELWCTQRCEDRFVQPKSLAISSFNFTLALGRIDVPKGCGDFRFENLGACSEELGLSSGCCPEKCVAAIGKISDQCWSEIEDSICGLESRKTAIMLDLLSRRCNLKRREILCSEKCGLKHKCDESSQNLLNAAKEGNIGRIKELISDGVSPRIIDVDNYEQTPLYWAAKQGDLRVLEVLIEAGAKVDARSNDGWTPLMTAASNNHLDVVVALAKAGADIDAQSNIGFTAIMAAADKGHLRVVKYLEAAGADLKLQTNSGETALGYAANADVSRFLISAGARDR